WSSDVCSSDLVRITYPDVLVRCSRRGRIRAYQVKQKNHPYTATSYEKRVKKFSHNLSLRVHIINKVFGASPYPECGFFSWQKNQKETRFQRFRSHNICRINRKPKIPA